jgi:hypothetical protein
MTEADFAATRTAPMDGNTIPVPWGLLHVLAHVGVHVGQMQMVRQLWDQANTRPEKEQNA